MDHAEELSKQQKKIDRLVKEVQNLRAHSTAVRMDKAVGVEQSQDYELVYVHNSQYIRALCCGYVHNYTREGLMFTGFQSDIDMCALCGSFLLENCVRSIVKRKLNF